MRAVVVAEYGGRAETVDLPAPEVKAGQVLIKVLALNFQVPASVELLERVANALAVHSIVPPPINRISLQQAPAVLAGANGSLPDGKTVIVV